MTRRLVGLLAVLLFLAPVLAGCGDDDSSEPAVALDGSPRAPDAEGRLLDVASDFGTVTLDGDRRYDVADDLIAFAAADGSVQPLLRLVDQYVQVGLDGDTVVWIGALSSVIETPDEPALAYFTDVLASVDGTTATFRSGTVLTLAGDVVAPDDLPAAVLATVAVDQRAVVALDPA